MENGDYVTLVPSQIFAGNRSTPSIAPVLLDAPMQPWQVMAISRAKHELSAVCLAFLAELQHTAAKIDLPMAPCAAGRAAAVLTHCRVIDNIRSRCRSNCIIKR